MTFNSVWKMLKMSYLNFWILAFSSNFWPIKIDLSGNSVWPQAIGFQKLAKLDHFRHFLNVLSTQNVNVARSARNVEWDFSNDFQTPCKNEIFWEIFKHCACFFLSVFSLQKFLGVWRPCVQIAHYLIVSPKRIWNQIARTRPANYLVDLS